MATTNDIYAEMQRYAPLELAESWDNPGLLVDCGREVSRVLVTLDITLPNIFANMALGRLWGSLFFLFMAFAALSTVLAVFENIICCGMELTGCTRKKSSLVNLFLIILLSMPCVLGYNLWAWDGFAVFGGAVLDFEDFLVSNLFLPLGSLVYLLFCVSRYGWGWDNYKKEVNTGEGLKIHDWMRGYLTYGLPVIVLFIFAFGIYDKFFA